MGGGVDQTVGPDLWSAGTQRKLTGTGRRVRKKPAPALGLTHVVVTSVDRDDLGDGGAAHFAAVIHSIRARCPEDHDRGADADFLRRMAPSKPWLRPVPISSTTISDSAGEIPHGAPGRPLLRFYSSAAEGEKNSTPQMFTKSGIMVDLGEQRDEVLQVMDDLRAADVDFLTIGQYLQPSRKHHAVIRLIPPRV